MEKIRDALWALVFVFAAQSVFQTCALTGIKEHVERIYIQMPSGFGLVPLSKKDLAELEYQLARIADNSRKCACER